MSFYTSLSGLNAAQTDLNVTSNNIANSNSIGFKSSRAEFGDLISASAFQSQSATVGQGTRLKSITQEFGQGSQETTSNALDLMIGGQGFFVTKSTTGSTSYTRDGAFSLNSSNMLVDSAGNQVQVLPVNSDGAVTATGAAGMIGLTVPATNGTSATTTAMTTTLTLPSGAAVPTDAASFNKNDPLSYNFSHTTTTYNGSGDAVPVTSYYSYNGSTTSTDASGASHTSASYTVHTFMGDQEVLPQGSGTAATVSFTDGQLDAGSTGITYDTSAILNSGGTLAVDLTGSTIGSSAFANSSFTQNGSTAGQLNNLTVDADGLVSASYSDGSTLKLGKVAVAQFTDPAGLHQNGNTTWTQTAASGVAKIGEANADGTTEITSGALEQSNVDLTAQLVNLISAQRNFQANAKAIDTDKQMLSYILNLQ